MLKHEKKNLKSTPHNSRDYNLTDCTTSNVIIRIIVFQACVKALKKVKIYFGWISTTVVLATG